jgi:hypothetical protein
VLLGTPLCFGLVPILSAQDAVKADPQHYKIVSENDERPCAEGALRRARAARYLYVTFTVINAAGRHAIGHESGAQFALEVVGQTGREREGGLEPA